MILLVTASLMFTNDANRLVLRGRRVQGRGDRQGGPSESKAVPPGLCEPKVRGRPGRPRQERLQRQKRKPWNRVCMDWLNRGMALWQPVGLSSGSAVPCVCPAEPSTLNSPRFPPKVDPFPSAKTGSTAPTSPGDVAALQRRAAERGAGDGDLGEDHHQVPWAALSVAVQRVPMPSGWTL
eukprot:Skav229378  [mRNA]  locus=scaffold584:132592:135812:- [translate_table: standard]